MQKRLVSAAFLTVAMAFACTLVPAIVLAHEGHDHSDDGSTTSSHSDSDDEADSSHSSLRSQIEAHKAERKAKGHARLEAAKLRSCEARKKQINTVMKRGSTRAENHMKVFDTITTRVKNFYEKKGKVLSNYDELVAAVDAAKAKATGDIATLKTLEGIDCNSDDPKGSVDDYKTALAAVREDLKAYRTAVKNLIVGVKSVQGEGNE